jgi:hypothetical protein
VVVHAFDASTQEAEAGGFLSSRPAWSTKKKKKKKKKKVPFIEKLKIEYFPLTKYILTTVWAPSGPPRPFQPPSHLDLLPLCLPLGNKQAFKE